MEGVAMVRVCPSFPLTEAKLAGAAGFECVEESRTCRETRLYSERTSIPVDALPDAMTLARFAAAEGDNALVEALARGLLPSPYTLRLD